MTWDQYLEGVAQRLADAQTKEEHAAILAEVQERIDENIWEVLVGKLRGIRKPFSLKEAASAKNLAAIVHAAQEAIARQGKK